MDKTKDILLGYEIGTGAPVEIPLFHTVVTGLTRKSGKTTTLEALIARSGLRALAFRTKRGESGFASAHRVQPFFRERADWQYVQALLEATMREKLKFERSWIIKACKGARSLRDVYERIVGYLTPDEKGRVKLRGIDEGVYTNLRAYLEIVLPEIERTPFARELRLHDGVNVMDLEDLVEEVKVLIVASSLQELYDNGRDTIVVIPEVWKFCPEGRGSPAKLPIEQLIREGAAVGLFLFFDSQDISGADKKPLKQCDNWILGRQREVNEVEHTLEQVPLPKKLRPHPEEIMQLKLGHFVACFDEVVKKVYARPAWLDEETAIKIAKGQMSVSRVLKAHDDTRSKEDEMYEQQLADALKEIKRLKDDLAKTRASLKAAFDTDRELRDKILHLETELPKRVQAAAALGELGQAIRDHPFARSKPAVEAPVERPPIQGGRDGPTPSPRTLQVGPLSIDAIEREATVTYSREPREFTTTNPPGRILFVLLEDLTNAPSTEGEIADAMREHGWNYGHNTMAPTLSKLVGNGDLVRDDGRPVRYRLPGKVEVKRIKA